MCEIEITKVAGNNPGLTSITVIGKYDRCPLVDGERLSVKLSCPSETVVAFDPANEFFGVFVDADDIFYGDDGVWFARFDEVKIPDCRCNGQMVVIAQCVAHPECQVTLEVDNLECVECPEITSTSLDDVVTLPRATCNDDGTATVKLARKVTNNSAVPIIAEIFPGNPDAVLDPPSQPTAAFVFPTESREISVTFRYPTLTNPTPYIVVMDEQSNPLGCPVELIPMGPIPACCPDINIDDISRDGCEVTVRMDPFILLDGCVYSWDWGDRSEDDDDNDIQPETTVFGQNSHIYTKTTSPTITVKVKCGDDECESEDHISIDLDDCVPNDGDDDCGFLGWRCWDWCLIGRVALFVSLATAAILWLMVLCFPGTQFLVVAAIAASAVAAVTMAIWQFTCGSWCEWYLILWQSSLVLSITALYLVRCCNAMIVAAIAGAISAGGFYLLWKDRCEPTKCEITEHLLWVFGTAAALAFAVIDQFDSSIPLFMGETDCRLGLVKIVVVVLTAIYTYKLGQCKSE